MKINRKTGLIEFTSDQASLMRKLNIQNASVNVTSAYVGDVFETLLELTVLGNQAVEKGSVFVNSGVQKELFMPRLTAAADQLQVRQEDPDAPSDSFTYDEESIAPQDMMFYDKVNPRNFEEAWRPFQPTGPLVDRVDNPQMTAAIMRETLKTIGAQLGKIIWQGDTGGAPAIAFFDGFEKLIEDSADSVKVTPAGPITEATVLDILSDSEASIPDSIWEDPNVVFHMSTTDLRLYGAAARALDFKGVDIADAMNNRYAGRLIRGYTGFSKDKIIVAKATAGSDSNLWAAIDVQGDEENVKIERFRPESENFIVKVLFKYGVGVPHFEETVIYLPV